MSSPQFRALRFVFPYTETLSDDGVGLQHSPRGGLSTVAGDDSIRQALLMLLSTRPGERVNRPTYGCSLHRLLFSPADDTTAGLAMHYVQQAVRQWEPRVDVAGLDAVPTVTESGDPVIHIELKYQVKYSASVDSLVVSVPLNDGSAA